VAVVPAGCAHGTDGARRELLRTGAWLIEVRNDRFDDCVIYLIRGGTPIPLGVAAGLSHRTFRVDPALLAEGAEWCPAAATWWRRHAHHVAVRPSAGSHRQLGRAGRESRRAAHRPL